METIGNKIFDAQGREIRLNGVSIIAWPNKAETFLDEWFDLIRSWNIGHVAIEVGWNFLEPVQGQYDSAYLANLDSLIFRANNAGLQVTLRYHKFPYPYGYQADYPDWPERWIVGFPRWIGTRPNFWENYLDCQQSYIDMFQMLAERYQYNPNVIAFGLMGEPGNDVGDAYGDVDWGTWDSNACRKVCSVLFAPTRLYKRTMDTIHSISPDKLVIFEGHSGITFYPAISPGGPRELVEKPDAPNIVAAQSLYQWFQYSWLDEQLGRIYGIWDIPYMASEVGVPQPTPENLAWIDNTCALMEQKGMSWSYWGFGPQGTAGNWGDFSLVGDDGSVNPVAEILAQYGFWEESPVTPISPIIEWLMNLSLKQKIIAVAASFGVVGAYLLGRRR